MFESLSLFKLLGHYPDRRELCAESDKAQTGQLIENVMTQGYRQVVINLNCLYKKPRERKHEVFPYWKWKWRYSDKGVELRKSNDGSLEPKVRLAEIGLINKLLVTRPKSLKKSKDNDRPRNG